MNRHLKEAAWLVLAALMVLQAARYISVWKQVEILRAESVARGGACLVVSCYKPNEYR